MTDSDSEESHRLVIEQQSALIQSLNDEINRTARLHAVFLGVIATGISIAGREGVLTLGINLEKELILQLIGLSPLAIAAVVGFSEIFLFWRGASSYIDGTIFDRLLPKSLPRYYSEFSLEPTEESINNNQKLIEQVERKIGIIHVHFFVILVLVGLWIVGHVVTN